MFKWMVGIIIVIIAFVAGYLLHKPKTLEKVTVVTKVEYKDRIVNKDTIIERKVYVSSSGTVVTEEKETIKDRIVEKEVIKEKEVEKQVPVNKDWMLTASYTHINKDTDIQGLIISRRIFGDLYIGAGVYVRMDMFAEDYIPKYSWQNITVSVSYLF